MFANINYKKYLKAGQDNNIRIGGFTSEQYNDIINLHNQTKKRLEMDYDIRNGIQTSSGFKQHQHLHSGGSLLNDALNNLPLPELHLTDEGTNGKVTKASFCGPYTNLKARLKNFDPETGEHTGFITKPINTLDYGCYRHDLAYNNSKDLEDRLIADKELEQIADFVIKNPESTTMQRANAFLVKKVMQSKQSWRM